MPDEPLKLGDALAQERTAMAAERTLMAWVRTSLSLIGFGFTIYKFLQSLQAEGTATRMGPGGPRKLGLFLIGLGAFPLVLAMVQHWHLMQRMGKTRRAILLGPTFLMAVLVALLGIGLFSTMLARFELF
jgi:putative membrane protein